MCSYLLTWFSLSCQYLIFFLSYSRASMYFVLSCYTYFFTFFLGGIKHPFLFCFIITNYYSPSSSPCLFLLLAVIPSKQCFSLLVLVYNWRFHRDVPFFPFVPKDILSLTSSVEFWALMSSLCVCFPGVPLNDNKDPTLSLPDILILLHFRDNHHPSIKSNRLYLTVLSWSCDRKMWLLICTYFSFFFFFFNIELLGCFELTNYLLFSRMI